MAGTGLSTNIKLAYASPAFALAVVGIPVYVYMPKLYTDVVGVDIAVLGALLFGVRLFDAVTDPLIGLWSDATRSRWGRRRPFIAAGMALVALSLFFLFTPPDTRPTAAAVWFGVWIYVLFFFWTMATVPFEALGPEITFDYHARTTLFGWRDGALIAGTLVAAASPALIQALFGLGADARGEREKFYWMAILYAPLLLASGAWCVASVSERSGVSVAACTGLLRGIRALGRNRPFWVLLASYTISAVGNNLPATLILFYVQYVLESVRADLFLMLYFVTGILLLPAWIALARRVGKKWAWLGAMGVNSGAFTGVYFLGPGDTLLYGLLVVASGIGFGATLALPSAIQADVIDYDELQTGRRREGLYIGLWSISRKLAAAVGVGAGLALLGASGYTPNRAQSPEVVHMLRVLYALVPAICNLLGLVIAMTYPIDETLHRKIRAQIDARHAVPSSRRA
ncbi:MFS transporter [Desulfatitalea alkaliphila]|uniref:Glycoside-pentoside-hexuronide (GPH):cation symporter n=1 Tax=Desulfatitalea alkaliphila TaxID=2929485 RepID=A0AA41UKB4_9BACT|nr:glycoside-pentoside-hexuronide (GPH):cation symporter [Desulfatitalea alkaliphila]MCJ8502875.1 glycoside-pentoside-hexuronide (GPH):cation symporter [Desulfatitalea alkaliphila]